MEEMREDNLTETTNNLNLTLGLTSGSEKMNSDHQTVRTSQKSSPIRKQDNSHLEIKKATSQSTKVKKQKQKMKSRKSTTSTALDLHEKIGNLLLKNCVTELKQTTKKKRKAKQEAIRLANLKKLKPVSFFTSFHFEQAKSPQPRKTILSDKDRYETPSKVVTNLDNVHNNLGQSSVFGASSRFGESASDNFLAAKNNLTSKFKMAHSTKNAKQKRMFQE